MSKSLTLESGMARGLRSELESSFPFNGIIRLLELELERATKRKSDGKSEGQ